MLELYEMTEEEGRHYLKYDANLIFKYVIKIMIVKIAIEKYGFREYMEQEAPVLDKEDSCFNIPFDRKKKYIES